MIFHQLEIFLVEHKNLRGGLIIIARNEHRYCSFEESWQEWHFILEDYFKVTPDYKDKKIETEKTKTYNTPFLSLKRPDFKYVIFKIVEVAQGNPPAKQHSRFSLIWPDLGQIGCAA